MRWTTLATPYVNTAIFLTLRTGTCRHIAQTTNKQRVYYICHGDLTKNLNYIEPSSLFDFFCQSETKAFFSLTVQFGLYMLFITICAIFQVVLKVRWRFRGLSPKACQSNPLPNPNSAPAYGGLQPLVLCVCSFLPLTPL